MSDMGRYHYLFLTGFIGLAKFLMLSFCIMAVLRYIEIKF